MCVGIGLLLFVAAIAVVGSWTPERPGTQVRVEQRLLPPLSRTEGVRHWLGTDALGRDILLRIASGARVSLLIGACAVLIGGTVGSVLGLVSGYAGGWADRTIMRFGDMQMAFPSLVLALAVLAVVGPGLRNIILVLGVSTG